MLALLLMHAPTGQAAPLTFRQAVELASRHNVASTGSLNEWDELYETCEGSRRLSSLGMWMSPVVRDSRDFGAALPEPSFVTTWRKSPVLQKQESRNFDKLLCIAITYAELVELDSQQRVLDHQEMTAAQLLNVEVARVRKKIDNPIALTRAKLLAAMTRMWAAEVGASSRLARRRLADLTGLSDEEVEPVADSMPPLSDVWTADALPRGSMKMQTVTRDVAQLEYTLSRDNRMRIRELMVVHKANLGDLLSSYITEDENFRVLLEANFEFQKEQLRLLQTTGTLDKWAINEASEHELLPDAEPTMSSPTARTTTANASRATPSVKSVMITPVLSALVAGQSRQYSAIAIFGDGSAKDATSEATWRSSCNSKAIISASGLLTALATGQVTITATVSGVSRSLLLTMNADNRESIEEVCCSAPF
jgi:hypothetical protein